jgi:hypothetical protein
MCLFILTTIYFIAFLKSPTNGLIWLIRPPLWPPLWPYFKKYCISPKKITTLLRKDVICEKNPSQKYPYKIISQSWACRSWSVYLFVSNDGFTSFDGQCNGELPFLFSYYLVYNVMWPQELHLLSWDIRSVFSHQKEKAKTFFSAFFFYRNWRLHCWEMHSKTILMPGHAQLLWKGDQEDK